MQSMQCRHLIMNTSTMDRTALEVGYRFLDCAQFYGNEKEVGQAIKDSKIPRGELFLASKVYYPLLSSQDIHTNSIP